jgi:hypothetical protein
MALADPDTLEIPPVAQIVNARSRRWREAKLRPHGTPAAHRRHVRRKEKICAKCRRWSTLDRQLRRIQAQLARMEAEAEKARPKNQKIVRLRARPKLPAYQRMDQDEYAELAYESLRAAEPF